MGLMVGVNQLQMLYNTGSQVVITKAEKNESIYKLETQLSNIECGACVNTIKHEQGTISLHQERTSRCLDLAG